MPPKIKVGIVAPSSKVPPVEFRLGVEQIEEDGFSVRVHPQVMKAHSFFAGTDEERARAFYELAIDPEIPVLWGARGGSGAVRILPILERLAAERGIPPLHKLYVGYSDSTAILEYVRAKWGWSTLHGPMPGMRAFCALTRVERTSLTRWVSGEPTKMPWKKLRFAGPKPKKPITAPVVGGNLAVWASLLGTPYAGISKDRILFFEDIGESLYRIDRLLSQVALSGGLKGARAIVLGNFEGCTDSPPMVLARPPAPRSLQRVLAHPKPSELAPLRPKMDAARAIPRIFLEYAQEFDIPVAYGLPVGHGPGHAPLPLGAEFRLGPDGSFELQRWDWYPLTF